MWDQNPPPEQYFCGLKWPKLVAALIEFQIIAMIHTKYHEKDTILKDA